jgi:hypothetical protein
MKPTLLAMLIAGSLGCSARTAPPEVTTPGDASVAVDSALAADVATSMACAVDLRPWSLGGNMELSVPQSGVCTTDKTAPKGRYRLERITVAAAPNGVVTNGLAFASVDATTPCNFFASVQIDRAYLAFQEGEILRVVTESGMANDQPPIKDPSFSTLVISDEADRLRFAQIVGTTPQRFASDLFSGLKLTVDSAAQCRFAEGDLLSRIHLKTGGSDCLVSSSAVTCCPIATQPYEIIGDFRGASSDYSFYSFQIREPGLVKPLGFDGPTPICR